MKKHLIAGIGLFLTATLLSSAQTSNGVIRGSVQDVTGAVLIDALVSSRNEATSQS